MNLKCSYLISNSKVNGIFIFSMESEKYFMSNTEEINWKLLEKINITTETIVISDGNIK